MKDALPSHTVGVNRSSSLAINHCQQLMSAQSACERTACVCVREYKPTCIFMCAFDCGSVLATILLSPPLAAH